MLKTFSDRRLPMMRENLDLIRKVRHGFETLAGIVNGVTFGGTAVLGATALMYNARGMIEPSVLYAGASEAVASYALITATATAAGYAGIYLVEKYQQHKVEDKEYANRWKEKRYLQEHEAEWKKEKELAQMKTKTETLEETLEFDKKGLSYKPISSVLKPKTFSKAKDDENVNEIGSR